MDENFKKMSWLAEQLYDPELPYHNFNHALYAVEVGKDICHRCRKEGILIDEDVVVAALLFHDAGYREDHREKGFDSKEAYAADLANQALKKMFCPQEFIDQVVRAIMSTQHDHSFVTNEEKAVRAADLSGLAGTYELFLENNRKLKNESELLSGKEISIEQWKENTKKIISFYLGQDIHLTKSYEAEDGRSLFHKRASENLERFLAE